MFDPMADLDDSIGSDPLATSSSDNNDGGSSPQRGSGGGNRNFADEIHSITIRARNRTFYLDLKESERGKFFKLSEKSRGGRKTTIVFDVEDLPEMIKAFQEMEGKVS